MREPPNWLWNWVLFVTTTLFATIMLSIVTAGAIKLWIVVIHEYGAL